MKKEFNNLVALLQKVPYSNEVGIAIQKLENKIDEVEKRMECARRSATEVTKTIVKFTETVDEGLMINMGVNDHDAIERGADDVITSLDLNEDMCIKDNWYNLFTQLQPIAVGKVKYEFPEEVYTIGNADNTEIIADVYESVFDRLVSLGVIIFESDERFPIGEGNKTNYVIKDNIFTDLIKNRQIDLSKVPIVEQKKEQYVGAPTMQCLNTHTFDKVKEVIQILKTLDNGNSVDGETMEYILDQVGMLDQVAKQLGLVNF